MASMTMSEVMELAFQAWLADGQWHTASEIAKLSNGKIHATTAGRMLSRLHYPEQRLCQRTGWREIPNRDYGPFAPPTRRAADEYAPTYEELRRRLLAIAPSL